MPHPEIANPTRRVFQELVLQDEGGRPVLVLVLRETWAWTPAGLVPLEQEPPIALAGEPHPALREGVLPSMRVEAELAFAKLSTDVLLLGTARPSERGGRQGLVRLRAGPIDKSVVVFGERRWVRTATDPALSTPRPLDGVVLRWEHAFGGPLELRNPLGVGYFGKTQPFVEDTLAPAIERPEQLVRGFRDTPEPAGFGAVGGGWPQRARWAGTYDEAWSRDRMPGLPADFDRRFFQGAPADQVAPRPFVGNEPVRVEGVGSGPLELTLPVRQRPIARVRLRTGDAQPPLMLDTVVIDADVRTVALTWRGHVVLERGAHDVRAIVLGEA